MSAKKAALKKDKPSEKPADTIEESYDELPYESYVYPQTHPERMYTIAKLFKLNPPDIHKARILEIGCAGGGNLIPIAMLYPKTKSLGIDLSSEQIEQAETDRKAMGIKNIEFRQKDITKLEKNAGEFDYIICHGVFSWVPDFVRDEIFEVCRRHLAKNGLAIISYNVLPGWAPVKSLREMMLFHCKSFATPAQQIHEAKQLLSFLYENTPVSNEAYRQVIDRERKILNSTNDSYVFHEHLESENHQYYLHEFVKMAGDHGLGYVGDSEISSMYLGNFNETVRKNLGAIKDIVRQEQYIDFLSNRRFRHSIVTHKENAAKITRNLEPARILDFYVQARFKPDPNQKPDDAEKRFIAINNATANFTTKDKSAAAALTALAEKARPVKIDEIANELKKKQNIPVDATKSVFLKNGFTLTLQNFISLHQQPHDFTAEVSKKPVAFAWARYQVEKGGKNLKTLTNLKRETINLPPFTKTMLTYLDGKHTHEALVDKMTKHVLKGDLKIHKENKPVTEEKEVRALLKNQLGPALETLAKQAFLEA